ncbi:MAG: metal ABC transporter ATP-binding protein [Candidatus Coatesbacteria bacterium]|nr:metal ABC transporter ATP-binding protein [Candidatus Coatesbacteria bacterium]
MDTNSENCSIELATSGDGFEKPIEVAGLSFAYPQALTPTLLNIDFELSKGAFLALIGPNGGGKTTFIKILLGELEPTEGVVRVFGRVPSELNELRAKIGYVSQKAHFDQSFPASALDVILMGSYFETGLFKRISRAKKKRARELMERFGIADLENAQIGKLSYGQQQRAFIARALMPSPKLLILDEPTVGIDTDGQALFYEKIARLNHELGITIMIVSHDIAQIAEHVEEIACLYKTMHWHSKSELVNEEVLKKIRSCELDAYLKEHLRHIEEFHRSGK